MKDYPLEAIGEFFEMPNKEAWLNKVDPSLAFLNGIGDMFVILGVITISFIGLAFMIRARARRR